jgi:hypothetical protein
MLTTHAVTPVPLLLHVPRLNGEHHAALGVSTVCSVALRMRTSA